MAGNSFKTALCAAFAVSLMVRASCGGKEGEDSAVKPPSEAQTKETDVETTAEETKGAQTSDASGKKFATVADFANSEEVQTQLELQKKSLDGSSMDIAITGEGNRLIYTLTYLELENGDGMAEELQQGLEAERETFVSVAKSIKLAVDVEDPIVVVQYLDSGGNEIYSAEFTAD